MRARDDTNEYSTCRGWRISSLLYVIQVEHDTGGRKSSINQNNTKNDKTCTIFRHRVCRVCLCVSPYSYIYLIIPDDQDYFLLRKKRTLANDDTETIEKHYSTKEMMSKLLDGAETAARSGR